MCSINCGLLLGPNSDFPELITRKSQAFIYIHMYINPLGVQLSTCCDVSSSVMLHACKLVTRHIVCNGAKLMLVCRRCFLGVLSFCSFTKWLY